MPHRCALTLSCTLNLIEASSEFGDSDIHSMICLQHWCVVLGEETYLRIQLPGHSVCSFTARLQPAQRREASGCLYNNYTLEWGAVSMAERPAAPGANSAHTQVS